MRKIADLTICPLIQYRKKEGLCNVVNMDICVTVELSFTSEDTLHTEGRNKELLLITVHQTWQLAHASLS